MALKHFNREKVTIETLAKLLKDNPLLNRAGPFNNLNGEDKLEGNMLIEPINKYLTDVGLNKYFTYSSLNYYSLTKEGEEAIQK